VSVKLPSSGTVGETLTSKIDSVGTAFDLPPVLIYIFLFIQAGSAGAVSLCSCLLDEVQTNCGTYRQCNGNNDTDNKSFHDWGNPIPNEQRRH
jgi:hypothetical protein